MALAKSSGYFAQHLVCNRPSTTMIPVRIRKHQFHWRSPALFFFTPINITNFIVLFIYLLHCTKTIIWNFIKSKLHVLIHVLLCLFIIVFMSSNITCKYTYMFSVANCTFYELWSKSRKIWKTESWAGPAYEARSYCKGTCFPLTELT